MECWEPGRIAQPPGTVQGVLPWAIREARYTPAFPAPLQPVRWLREVRPDTALPKWAEGKWVLCKLLEPEAMRVTIGPSPTSAIGARQGNDMRPVLALDFDGVIVEAKQRDFSRPFAPLLSGARRRSTCWPNVSMW